MKEKITMARKKKKEQNKQGTPLYYEGSITTEYTKNGVTIKKTTHNSGLRKLFELIGRSLSGENTSKEYPRFIVPFNVAYENIDATHMLTASFVPTTDIKWSAMESSATVTMKFTIPYNFFTSSQDKIKCYVLFNSQNLESRCAFVNIAGNGDSIPDRGENVVLSWKMTIGNKENS